MKNFTKLISLTTALLALGYCAEAKDVVNTTENNPIVLTVTASSTNTAIGSSTEVITFSSLTNVQAGDSITIGGPLNGKPALVGRQTFTFTTNTTTNIPPNGVVVGTNFARSLTNLYEAITAGANGGTDYSNSVASTLVTAAWTTCNSITLTASTTNFLTLGVSGNNVAVTISQVSGDIQVPYNAVGLYGGYDSVRRFTTGKNANIGLGVDVYFHNTNGGAATNLTQVVIGASGVRNFLVGANATNITPSITISQSQASVDGTYHTNIAPSLVGGCPFAGVIQTINANTTNSPVVTVVFSEAIDDGK